MKPKAWRQSTPYSCGAACLMCALSEINGFEMRAENEIRLWETLHPAYYPGILPASIALYAHKNDVPAKIIYSEDTVFDLVKKLSPAYEPVKDLLFSENRASVQNAQKEGIEVDLIHHNSLFENIMENFLTLESRKLIMAIELSFARLHYVLIRKGKNDSFLVMDPAAGENFNLKGKDLLKEYGRHAIGIFVLLG